MPEPGRVAFVVWSAERDASRLVVEFLVLGPAEALVWGDRRSAFGFHVWLSKSPADR